MLYYKLLLLLVLTFTAAAQNFNLNKPTIVFTSFSKSLRENSEPATLVGIIRVNDPDEGEAGEVSCQVISIPKDAFRLAVKAPKTYALMTRQSFDREVTSQIRVKIICKDQGTPDLHSYLWIDINIGDENDHAPSFPSSNYLFTVREGVQVGAIIGQTKAMDRDAGKNSRIRYSLRNDYSNIFRIDDRGRLYVERPLDRERKARHRFIVYAVDMGEPMLTATATVEVAVEDVNDNTPRFTKMNYQVKVPRNASIGYSMINLKATDADEGRNSLLQYFLKLNASGRFAIDSDTGRLYVAASLAEVQNDTLKVLVGVRDSGTYSQETLTMVIVSLYGPTQRARPVFLEPEFWFIIKEYSDVNSVVGNVTAYNKDGTYDSRIRYRLDSSGNKFFTINRYSGQIRRRNTSLEGVFGLVFNVTASMGMSGNRSLTATVPVYVNVTREEKSRPRISFHYRFWIRENEPIGTRIGQIQASGADTIRYQLDGNSTLWLQVDNVTGILSTAAVLDRESMAQVNATALAFGRSGSSASTSVMVDIQDVNDCSPSFAENVTIFVNEGGHDAALVPQTRAVDCDVSPPNNNVSYRLLDSPFAKHFEMLADGRIRLKSGNFDREKITSFNVTLVATDKGSPKLSGSLVVIVNIDDINDNAPRWLTPVASNSTVTVALRSPVGTIITTVKAVDADVGENGRVVYSLITLGSPFNVSRSGGVVRTTRALTKKDVGTRRLRLRASDLGKPTRRSSALLDVVIE